MKTAFTRIALAAACMAFAGPLLADEPRRPECIAPAAPGRGFGLACKPAQSALLEL